MRHILFVCFCLSALSLHSQITVEGQASGGFGQRWNVFNAPESYARTVSDTLTADSLVVHDPFYLLKGSMQFKWRKGKHKVRLSVDGETRQYSRTKVANTEQVQTRLYYDHRSSRRWKQGLQLRLRNQQRLGINVLGDELLTPFSFRQLAGSGYLKRQSEAKHTLRLEANLSYKRYDACPSCGRLNEDVSLSQFEWSVEVEREWELARRKGDAQSITWEVSFRDRDYSDWFNYELLHPNPAQDAIDPFLPFDSLASYQPRAWNYLSTELDYVLPLDSGIRIKPRIEFTRRLDVSNGDFGFHQWQPGVYIYIDRDPWYVKLEASYTIRNYTDRLAAEASGTPYPLLEYRYARASGRVERYLGSGFGLWMEAAVTNRNSNTTSELTRVRRSYLNGELLGGLTWEFEGSLTGQRNQRNNASSDRVR